MTTMTHEDGTLRLDIVEDDETVRVIWSGRSTAREPGQFILPILTEAVENAERTDRRVVIDFRRLEYLNSSTITPMIRVLELAKRGTVAMSVIYDQKLKWQALSFSALYLFQTHDDRVKVEPL